MNKETFQFQLENKKKLKKIGKLPSIRYEIPIILNRDGTISALFKKDEARVKEINKVTEIIKKKIQPLIDYIRHDIFCDNQIMSQELIINEQDNVLAKCDLSSKNAILEIKAFIPNMEKIKYQLYYQANGRPIYFLQTEWNTKLKKGLIFTIYKVNIIEKEAIKVDYESQIKNKNLKVLKYDDTHTTFKLQCKKCGYKWKTNMSKLQINNKCPMCNLEEIMRNFRR